MKHMKTVDVPATTKTIVDRVTCDLCGRGLDEHYRGNARLSSYYDDEVEIKQVFRRRRGTNYPECGSGTEDEVDICGECWETKLIPWLKSQGVEPQTRDWDW
jgi:hypothetical protein